MWSLMSQTKIFTYLKQLIVDVRPHKDWQVLVTDHKDWPVLVIIYFLPQIQEFQ